ncbi:MAG: hypothetical protein JNM76_09995 [Betaproteobacteria bacterium]|nr:hypothetical protein [Betaproteobacteria bacterium]
MKLQAIDDSNRSAHYYLTPQDQCYFFHEFTAKKGFNYSPGNQFIFNFKKSPTQAHEGHYQYKTRAIASAIRVYRELFERTAGAYAGCTLVPIPPSKVKGHPEYDDRMWQVVRGIGEGKDADTRELITQTQSYEASHLAGDTRTRIKPDELEALYQVDARPPKSTIILFDDVLSAGCHFRAAKSAILSRHPGVQVVGFFLARRVFSDPVDDFEPL